MNDFYEQKARKYKYKYLKLKQEIEGGSGILYKSKAQKKAAKHAQEEAAEQAALDKKCRDIIADENINGILFYNGAKGSYNKLKAERQKDLDNRESSVRDVYNIEAFKKDGCPTSEQENNKIIKNNEAYDLRKAAEEKDRPRLEAEAKARDEAYNRRKAAELAANDAKIEAMKKVPGQYEAWLTRMSPRNGE